MKGVQLLRNLVSVVLSALVATAAVLIYTANADPTCGTNFALDPATNTCKPIYSTPSGGCNPTTTGDGTLRGCLGGGGGWEDTPITTDEMYAVICQNLFLNGVTVGSIEDIYHWLYEVPYSLSGRDAGRSVALAIQYECPEYKSEAVVAMQQAASGS